MPYVVRIINLFLAHQIGHQKWRVLLAFRQRIFEGFFRTRPLSEVAVSLSLSCHTHSLRPIRRIRFAPIDRSARAPLPFAPQLAACRHRRVPAAATRPAEMSSPHRHERKNRTAPRVEGDHQAQDRASGGDYSNWPCDSVSERVGMLEIGISATATGETSPSIPASHHSPSHHCIDVKRPWCGATDRRRASGVGPLILNATCNRL
jgi:hypothetical protein